MTYRILAPAVDPPLDYAHVLLAEMLELRETGGYRFGFAHLAREIFPELDRAERARLAWTAGLLLGAMESTRIAIDRITGYTPKNT